MANSILTDAERTALINELATKRNEFNRRVEESGLTPQMFVIMDRTGFASKMLYIFHTIAEFVRVSQIDITVEPLVPGAEISVTEKSE